MAALKKWGTGSGASRLISGNVSLYTELETECARFKETESALVFSSGYYTNIGVQFCPKSVWTSTQGNACLPNAVRQGIFPPPAPTLRRAGKRLVLDP